MKTPSRPPISRRPLGGPMMLVPLALVLFALLVAPVAQAGYHPPPPCGELDGQYGDHDICTPYVRDGASCVSYGIIVIATDLLTGTVTVDHSESRAETHRTWGPWPDNPFEPLVPPEPATAHADAQQVGFSYDNGFVGVSASLVHSRCDVAAVNEYTEAYGRAGVQDLSIRLGAFAAPIEIEVLDFELETTHVPGHGEAWTRCSVVNVNGLDVCTGGPYGFVSGFPYAAAVVDHQWGPTFLGPDQLAYGGAALHVAAGYGALRVDVYVGYVTTSMPFDGSFPPLMQM